MRSILYAKKTTSVQNLKLCLETGKCFEEIIRGRKEVKNLEIFEFGFRMIWRIVQISEAVIPILPF